MDINNFKHIVGQAKQDEPAIIRFFGGVDYSSVESFKEEFLFLQNYMKPSKIIVMINSEGGSVMYGMIVLSRELLPAWVVLFGQLEIIYLCTTTRC